MAAAAILTVADWAQTRYIAKNPNDYRELNPILGSHPSVGKVNIYFSTVLLLGTLGISTGYINREFLYFYVGIEGSTVVRNYQVGVEIRHYVDDNTIVLSVHNRGAGNQVGDAYYLSFGV